jgi:hypothetical protein
VVNAPLQIRNRQSAIATLPGDPTLSFSSDQRGFGSANCRVVLDWLDAIEHDREAQCSGYNATKALEFVMATYQAALDRKPVSIPLATREHPLCWAFLACLVRNHPRPPAVPLFDSLHPRLTCTFLTRLVNQGCAVRQK